MHTKNYALIGGAAIFGLAFIFTAGVARANERVDVPQGWQVAANDSSARSDRSEPGISMDEMSRRMEKKYDGKVMEIELDREWNGDVYEMEIHSTDGYEWDIEADANSGEIIKEERERDND